MQGPAVCRFSASIERDGIPHSASHILEGAVDDPFLANPLRRQEMLGTAWFGALVEYEGVLVDSAHDDHMRAWYEVWQAENAEDSDRQLPQPNPVLLERSEGMKSEQVCIMLLSWCL